MIRPAKEPLRRKPYCRRVRPRLFWRQCEQCGNEFRGEDMWVKKLMGLGMGGRNREYTTYICTHCAPTIEIAETLFCAGEGAFPMPLPAWLTWLQWVALGRIRERVLMPVPETDSGSTL